MEKFCGEPAFSGKTFRGEKIFQPVSGHGPDLEIALADQPFQESVYQAQRDIQPLGQLSLTGVAVPVDFSHETEDIEVLFLHPELFGFL